MSNADRTRTEDLERPRSRQNSGRVERALAARLRKLLAVSDDSAELHEREANVVFASDLLDTEIAQRNARKDAQENTARGLIVTSGLVLTLLLALAKDAELFAPETSAVARIALAATMAFGAAAATCAIGTLWPRPYDRIGSHGLDHFNDTAFLDQAEHAVVGRVVASRIEIAKTMDRQHEAKARWLKWSFRLLLCAFVGLVVQGSALSLVLPDGSRPLASPSPSPSSRGE
jgi:hypothetical protein